MDGNKPNVPEQQFISFQDFSPINKSGGQALLDIDIPIQQSSSNFPNQPTAPISENLQTSPEQSTETSSPSFWTIEYYQKYFNVTTKDVVERIKWSVIPYGGDNLLLSHIRPNPDLYGPFWICVTLVFSIAISGNMANYYHSTANGHWKYDFHLVSIVATCIFLYAWLLPLAIWGALKWTNTPQSNNNPDELIQSNNTLGLLEIICVYGYSLAIYVPVAFLWVVQISWFQWSLVIIAAGISGAILLRSLLPAISGKHKLIYMVIMIGMHILLATGFMLYFFYDNKSSAPDLIPVTLTPPKTVNSTSIQTR